MNLMYRQLGSGLLPTLVVFILTYLLTSSNPGIAIGAGIASGVSGLLIRYMTQSETNKQFRQQKDRLISAENQLKVLENVTALSADLPHLESKYKSIKSDFEQLKEDFKNKKDLLGKIEGELSHSQGEYTKLKEDVSILEDKENELKRRIGEINLQNPDLGTKEKLYRDVEALKQSKHELEAKLKVLEPKVESYETVKQELITVSGELERKKPHLEELRERVRDYEQKAAELELLRATYDAIVIDRTHQETRLKTLRPEVEALELQKQQILQAIRENQTAYLTADRQREELRKLSLDLENKQGDIAKADRYISHLTGVIEAEEKEKARLETSVKNLRTQLGELKQEISTIEDSADKALQSLSSPLWINLPTQPKNMTENEFITGFQGYLQSQGLSFPERVVRAFHTSLKVQDISALVILAGISGTGKSELPQRYADYIGAQKLTLAVQPRWDSPQDLQGFYNYIEKKYKPTELMRGLYQYQNDNKMKDRLVVVLLDEMNLARVEYYFSDFLSKLETRRSQPTYLDLDVGSLPLPEAKRRLPIPSQFLFVGTMNEDETTQSLSDKVLDRANVLCFGKPQALKLREEFRKASPAAADNSYISYTSFQQWSRKPSPDSEMVKDIKNYLDDTNNILQKIGHPFAHRVYQAITAYVINYPGVTDNERYFKQALADQFGQKLLPKLRGLMLDSSCNDELEELGKIINKIGDDSLSTAFEEARQGRFGQFQWRGLVYKGE